jgi:hypothetical protein
LAAKQLSDPGLEHESRVRVDPPPQSAERAVAVTNYREARNEWSKDMEDFSKRRTDLVGKPPKP